MKNDNNTTPETSTTSAIVRLEDFLHSIGHDPNVYHKNDMVYVEFPKKVELSEDQMSEIRDIFYWTNSIEVPFISGLVHFYEFSNTLLISTRHYDKIVQVHDFIVSEGMELLEFDICDSEFSFKYDIGSRDRFNYDDIDKVKKMVDPEDEHPRSVIVYGGEQIYSMSIKP